MGLFSFLGGSKPATDIDTVPDARVDWSRGSSTAVADESPAAAKDASATGASTDPLSQSADTPFAPPEGWNLDAFAAPAVTPDAEKIDVGPADAALTAEYQSKIIEVIKTVFDPEIPVDIYELGLIYEIIVDADHKALVRMTLTSPACPSAQQIPSEVRYKVKAVPGIVDAFVEIVWEPPWSKERMSDASKLQLGFL